MAKIIYSTALLLLLVFIPLTNTQAALSDAFSATSPLQNAAQASGYKTTKDNNALALASTVITVVLSIVGTIFVVLMIYAGVTWMLAEGNEQRAEKARDIMKQAIIGLIIVIGAYGISYALLQIFSTQLKS
jgi:cytochrome bd-type quinol oxidase subunit 2